MNSKVHEFDPQVYPTRLWVAKGWEIKFTELDELFYAVSKEGEIYSFKDQFKEDKPNDFATTYPVGLKKTGWRGCLVVIHRKDTPIAILTHEASHCTDWLFEQLGIMQQGFDDGEPRAYYTQWVFQKLYDVKTNKVK